MINMHETVCPNCGHCPTCGRSNAGPYVRPWQTYPWNVPYTNPYINPWWQNGGSITIKPNDNNITYTINDTFRGVISQGTH